MIRSASPNRPPSRTRRGATTVEFAIVAPVFFLFLLASIEFSRLNIIRHTADNAAYEAARIATRGYATNRDAWIEGLSVLGVPIFQGAGSGQVVAVMALAAATPRFDRLGEDHVAERLLAAASIVSGRLQGADRRPGRSLRSAGSAGADR